MMCVLENYYSSAATPPAETTCFKTTRDKDIREKIYSTTRTSAIANVCDVTDGLSCGNLWDDHFIGPNLRQMSSGGFHFTDAEADRGLVSFQDTWRTDYTACANPEEEYCTAIVPQVQCQLITTSDITIKKVTNDKYLILQKKHAVLGNRSEDLALCESNAPKWIKEHGINTVIFPIMSLDRVK